MPDAPAATPAPASAAPVQQAAASTPTAGTSPTPAAGTTTPTTTPNPSTATPPAAGTEVKTGEQPAATKTPETAGEQPKPYELKLPENAAIDATIATELAAVAHKAGISQEHAQAIAEFMNGKAGAFLEQVKAQQVEAHQNQVKTWDEALKTDKEIGGEKIQANLDLGRRALEKFATPEAITFLRESGLNSHPELARIFVRIGKAMGEDTIATGNGGGGKSDEQILAERYPKMAQKSA